MYRPKVLVFASGSAYGGGSGFEKLVIASRVGELDADIVDVISNYINEGMRTRADRLMTHQIFCEYLDQNIDSLTHNIHRVNF